ncbi:MAG: excinuclease ABC subunit UvrC [Deltaproteobacteria bacterium]|nr:MAG: excinuclease ABC subunit UvrC [Deltaproteobacteria bacterium]
MKVGKALREKLDRLPAEPGVYLMKDAAGRVIYVGKAVNLKARVRSYFGAGGGDDRILLPFLVGELGDLEVILTSSEKEALLLENELIKKHQPRYNVLLRDDKNFITLRLDLSHPYPKLDVWRMPARDGARYFGPYASAAAVRETLRIVNRHFQLRTCSDAVLKSRKRPCLQYQIGRCPAPCVYEVPEYRQHVEDTVRFLEGRHDELVQQLRRRMEEASERLDFERAARLRDQLFAVERTLERQRVVDVEAGIDRDVFGFYREGPSLEIQVLFVRSGRLCGGRSFAFRGTEFPTEELLRSFVEQYYETGAFIPQEILLPVEIEAPEALARYLGERRGRKVEVLAPRRGEKRRLVELAQRNAAASFEVGRRHSADMEEILRRLQSALGLRNLPRRIEGYDISQVQGSDPVASRVTLRDGLPDKSGYRRYRIRRVEGQDDFAMMREVLTRRILRGLDEGDLPDLIVVDGGKGQLGVALAVLTDTGVDTVDLVALAKSRPQGEDEAGMRRSPERVFLPGRKEPVVLKQNSAELLVLTRLRDEAHRFAITFHRARRRRRTLESRLEHIAGVGPGRRRRLLAHFGSLKALKGASVEEIARVPGIGPRLADKIHRGLHG